MLSIEDSLDVFQITQMLLSPDLRVSGCAWDQLLQAVSKRTGTLNPTDDIVHDFFNSPPASGKGSKGDVRSLWNVVRRSMRRLEVSVCIEGRSVSIECLAGDINESQRDKVTCMLRQQSNQLSLQMLRIRAELLFPSASLPALVGNGKYMSFAQYRFRVKARCNLLPIRTVNRRIGLAQHDFCTRCTTNQPETMAHILNCCPLS